MALAGVPPAPGEEREEGHDPERDEHDEEHGDVKQDCVLVEARYLDYRLAGWVGARLRFSGREPPKEPRKMIGRRGRRGCVIQGSTVSGGGRGGTSDVAEAVPLVDDQYLVGVAVPGEPLGPRQEARQGSTDLNEQRIHEH